MLNLYSIEDQTVYKYLRITGVCAIGLLTFSILSSLFQGLEPAQTTLAYILEKESQNKKHSYEVPKSLTDAISDEGIAIVTGWANELPVEHQQIFLHGIARMMKDSAKRGKPRFDLNHLDMYREMEFARIKKITAMRAVNKNDTVFPKVAVVLLLLNLLICIRKKTQRGVSSE